MKQSIIKPKIKVGVLCGGQSSEREISLLSGKNVLDNLDPKRFRASLIVITKEGRWLERKEDKSNRSFKPLAVFDTTLPKPNSDLSKFDVIFIALHGPNGEDGRIQALLETIGKPYSGSGVLASALAMDKVMASKLVSRLGISIPSEIIINHRSKIEDGELKQRIRSEIGYPCVVKPNKSGSSIAISIVDEPKGLSPAVRVALKEDKTAIIQQYIRGRELTCSILGNAGENALEALPVVEIITPNKFFDFEAKYTSAKTQEIVPAKLTEGQIKNIQTAAKKVHETLGCRGLTRSDFILTKDNKLYFLEINTVPGLTKMSLSPKSAKAAGMSLSVFFEKLIELAFTKGSA